MLRTRYMNGQIYGKKFIKIDVDKNLFIMQREKWGDDKDASVWTPQDIDAFYTDEILEWLPER